MKKRELVIAEGKRLKGQLYYSQQNRYDFRPGGSADCSSFYQHCLKQAGVNPGDWTGAQLQRGRKISRSELLPGDAAFYGVGTGLQHVVLYIGNGQVLSHGGPGMGPVLTSLDYRSDISQYRRYIEEEGEKQTEDTRPADWRATGTATCRGDGVNIRQEPGGTIIGMLGKGNRFEVDGKTEGSWVHVYVNGKGVGYVHADYVQYDGKPLTEKEEKEGWKATGTATCTGEGVNVRQTAGGTVIGHLGKGNRFEVNGTVSGEWLQIKVAGFGICWINERYVQHDRQTEADWKAIGTATCTGDGVNVRSTPEENSDRNILGQINRGNRFEVNGEFSGAWIRIKVAGIGVGYIHKNWVRYDLSSDEVCQDCMLDL